MKKNHLKQFLVGLIFLLGFVVIGREGAATSIDGSTAVRVLLDKAIPKGNVKSILYSTYYRTLPERGWINAEKELDISLGLSQRSPIFINSKPVSEPFVFVRGGKNPSDKLVFQGETFRGALKWIRKNDSFSVVNYLSLEDYLLGTLGSEMSASWEIEALKAQAVASRTYALYMLQHPRGSEHDLEKTTHDQVYGGVQAEDPRVQEAIRSTRDQVLIFQGQPIKAFFHSRCGGSTETPAFVWNHRQGYPQKKVSCPFCIKHPFSWQALVKAQDLLRWTGLDIASTFRIEPGTRGDSGRLASLNLVTGNQKASIHTDTLRSYLGYARLKSAKFGWRFEGDHISFEGVGNGHGVGMCQWGARYLAQQGKNYKEILTHYYPGTLLQLHR